MPRKRLSDDFEENQVNVKEKVRQFMTDDETCRNNDNYLVIKYWLWESRSSVVYLDAARDLTPAKDIINARNFIQNKEVQLLPTIAGVLFMRRFKADRVRAFFGESSRQLKDFEELVYGVA